MKSIIFISEGNDLNSSTSHRCLMISGELERSGYSQKVYTRDPLLWTIPNIFAQFTQWLSIIRSKPDVIVLHRSSNLIDFYMMKHAQKYSHVIFDFDDALFHVRNRGKIIAYSHINSILRSADAVLAGSHYLMEYAERFSNKVFLIPTCVDTQLFNPEVRVKSEFKNNITIGWLGEGNSVQLRYLKLLKIPLNYLAKKYNIQFRIVSAQSDEVRSEFKNQAFDVDFGIDHWAPIEEVPRLIADFDIGVMPLTDEPFSRGKCAMKALEYMSMGIPVVASAVGENNYAILNNHNGFLVSSQDEWAPYLEQLISDEELREKMGNNGRDFVKENFSREIITNKIIRIIEGLK